MIWYKPPTFLMGHMTWPHPYQGHFVVRRLGSFCVTLWGTLGITYTVYLWLVGKRVFDFLLVLIEIFLLAFTVVVLWADIGRNRCVWKGWVTLNTNFKGYVGSPTNDCWRQKTRVPGLSRGVVCVNPMFIRFETIPACDRRTVTRWWLIPAHRKCRSGKNANMHSTVAICSCLLTTVVFGRG